MKIKTQGSNSSTNKLVYFLISIIGIALAVYFIDFKKTEKRTISGPYEYFCGAENVNSNKQFVENDTVFTNGQTQSTKEAFEGKHSSHITPDDQYSIGVDYENFNPGDKIEISVWAKSQALEQVHLAAVGIKSDSFYRQTNTIYSSKNDWHQIILNITVPEDFRGQGIKAFAYFSGKYNEAYIDNFKLVNINQKLLYNLSLIHI